MIWPSNEAIQNCIAWNEGERVHAERDARNPLLKVPQYLAKIDDEGKKQPLSTEDYRHIRAGDAERFVSNIQKLRTRLND